jgi:hypothetical protein
MKIRQLSAVLALIGTLLLVPRANAAVQTEVSLAGRAVLPAATFAPGPISGTAIGAGPFNGFTVPFASQPVQGFSAVLDAGDGSFLVMEDNGYGAKANSADFLLRMYVVTPDFKTAKGGSGNVKVGKFIQLSDPDKKVNFPIVQGNTSARLLTGADFDIESVRRDRKGDFWFGDEFGPFLIHTDRFGRVLEAPIQLAGVQSPDNPFRNGAPNTLGGSRGFEGMAISEDRKTLYPMLEGALLADPDQKRRLIYAFDLASKRYTGKTFAYRMDVAGYSIGDFTRYDDNSYLVIERDQNQGAPAAFKRIYLVDFRHVDADGYLVKTLLVNLMNISDPNGLSLPGRPGDIGLGATFTFPFVTIESVLPLEDGRLLVINDNNFPFSVGRNPGRADDNEFIVLDLKKVKVPSVAATYTLPDLALGQVQNAVLPGSLQNDRGMLLGGIGSDLWHGQGDEDNEYWMITDRGPNGQIRVNGVNRRTFPVPDFTPHILNVRVNKSTGGIDILRAIPIVGQSGKGVTGLSNLTRDEPPFDFSAQVPLSLNQSGLDSEGLVRTRSGQFWVAEEYGPSILKIDANGKVLKRYSPQGVLLPAADYPTVDSLPAIFEKRKINRGFEGLAISRDERVLYIALQSPLSNPNRTIGDASRNTRIVAFDIASEKVIGEYIYRLEEAATFDPSLPSASEMKLSGLIAERNGQLLVLERTDNVAKVYRVDLTKATNIVGSTWDSTATSPALEALADPASVGLLVLPKTLLVDLSILPGVPGKIEGIALNEDQLVIANDNDFDIGTFVNGVNQGAGAKSKILVIEDVFSDDDH